MKTSEIHGYYINPDHYEHRREKIRNLVNSLGLKSVNRVAFNKKFDSKYGTMCMAHISAIEKAIEDNNFPFILFEDDCGLIKPLPEEINIPDCTLIYLGGSIYNCGGRKKDLFLEDFDKDYYRVYNMLAVHSLLIPNKEAAEVIIDLNEDAITNNFYNDVEIAVNSEKYTYLTPKDGPYFYQDDPNTEHVTKFEWKDNLNLLK